MTMGKQVEVDSQSLTECSIDRMGSYTLYPVWELVLNGSDHWKTNVYIMHPILYTCQTFHTVVTIHQHITTHHPHTHTLHTECCQKHTQAHFIECMCLC